MGTTVDNSEKFNFIIEPVAFETSMLIGDTASHTIFKIHSLFYRTCIEKILHVHLNQKQIDSWLNSYKNVLT